MKYELTGESTQVNIRIINTSYNDSIWIGGNLIASEQTVYQVRATKDFMSKTGLVKAGTIGGYIWGEESLPQDDNSWLDEESYLCNGAKISGETMLISSSVQGEIVVVDSILQKTRVHHDLKNEEAGYLIGVNSLNSTLETSVFVEGGSFKDVFHNDYSILRLKGNIRLKNMYYSEVDLEGDGEISNCSMTCKLEGKIENSFIHRVWFKRSTKLNGTLNIENCKLTNLNFEGGVHSLKDVTFETTQPVTAKGNMQWNQVKLHAKKIILEGDTTFEHVFARYIDSLEVQGKLSMSHTWMEKKSQLIVLSGKETSIMGEFNASKKKMEQYSVKIDSELLILSGCEFEGDVLIKGMWRLSNVYTNGLNYIISHNIHINDLDVSKLSDFSGIELPYDSKLYIGRFVYLTNDFQLAG